MSEYEIINLDGYSDREEEIRLLAEELISQHNLDGWSFEWDRAKKRLGACHYSTKKITLSSILGMKASDEVVRETLLHEIAHALAPIGSQHDWRWRQIALSIGSSGERCHSEDTKAGASYTLNCPGCGVLKAWHRRPKRGVRTCGKCGSDYRTDW